MNQPEVRISENQDSRESRAYQPIVKAVKVTVAAAGADKVVLPVEAGTYVRCVARIATVLNNIPTVDVGTATTADALIANANLDATSLNAVAESVGGIFFAAAGNVTIDVGGTPDQGEVDLIFELYNIEDMKSDPHNVVAITA